MVNPIISVKGLDFKRSGQVIFNQLSFDVMPGSITVVMGPSGAGKTTLLRLLTAQMAPLRGQVTILGCNPHALSSQRLRILRQKMSILFQEGGLFSDLNVFDNVAFPLRQHTDLTAGMIKDLVLLMLHAVGLSGVSHLNVYQLSGGMARRVALARSIIMSPSVIFYDEPFAGQDPVTRGVLLELIRSLNEALAMTSVVVSHNVREAMALADRILMISSGEVIAEGAPEDLMISEDARVQQFIRGDTHGPFSCQGDYTLLKQELLG